eukprot:TRINITY_DN6054_c0_g1_i1.p1 TRINITY_DN6054_c0_g1~~TRINITY_DN6054_c0_g1_i1.p1  ORF type:complete len:419 (+),score=131.11 TRINITY_DN6054_c0_g1_i1:48-1304(+)
MAAAAALDEGAWLCKCGAVTRGDAVCRIKKCRKGRKRYAVPRAAPPDGALRVVEFYSGMGGMHQALVRAGVPAVVVAAYDVNEHANAVYAANFTTPVFALDLLRVGAEELAYHNADIWTMSPPCQPYTRQGGRLGADDHRSDSFFTLLKCLKELTHPPRYILIENVYGFEGSASHAHLVETLTALQYSHTTALLNSLDFGVPNSRPRTYVIARRGLDPVPTELVPPKPPVETIEAWLALPSHRASEGDGEETMGQKRKYDELEGGAPADDAPPASTPPTDTAGAAYDVSDVQLRKALPHYDVCGRACQRSACFTKAYGRHAKGSGSLLLRRGAHEEYIRYREKVRNADPDASFAHFGLRLFTPHEVKVLLGFPPSFAFPDAMPDAQRYKILGNSLSVVVVAWLFDQLVADTRPAALAS